MRKTILKNLFKSILMTIPFFLLFVAIWFFNTWNSMNVNELLFNLKMSLQGASVAMIKLFIIRALLPTVVVFLVILLLLSFIFKNPMKGIKRGLIIGLDLIVLFAALSYTWIKLDITSFIRQQLNASTFIEDNYVDPKSVEITFPEKKRNLIYIFLESMEVSDTDKENGGAFTVSRIPELTDLALQNESFAGSFGILNGGYSLPGSEWTMGAIFAQTCGLPLKINIEENSMSTQESFFPGVTGIGDILNENGYTQEFLCGSEVEFGGRGLFFRTHGNYNLTDYVYAKKEGWIPEDYSAWWGFEDEKLFDFAKKRLTELSKEDAPFNLTLLTADTHFEDGYVCRLCGDEFEDQYSNVYACSSRQVTEFIEWIKKQSFYDNTTIVISGDHPTMDADFCAEIPENYERKVYTCIINSAAVNENKDEARTYSTFDAFPTTLASLGVKIEGDKLGLGTNLFSSKKTLLEDQDMDYVCDELSKKSNFMNDLSGISQESIAKLNHADPSCQVSFDITDTSVTINAHDFADVAEQIKSVELEYKVDGLTENKHITQMKPCSDGSYEIVLNLDDINPHDTDFSVRLNTVLGATFTLFSQRGDMYLKQTDLTDYLKNVKEYVESGNYTLLITTRKNSAARLNDDQISLLHELGITDNIPKGEDATIIGIITSDNKDSVVSKETTELSGTLKNGYPITLKGSWNSTDEKDFLMDINGTNYMVARKGLHFAVVNNKTGHVADYADFDLIDSEVRRQ